MELNTKNESETIDQKRDDYEIPADLESDGNKNNYQMKLANESGNNFEDTKVVDSTNENIKHSAEHSVASSGFESLDQSNSSVNRHGIEQNEKDYGVTIADKENLGKKICSSLRLTSQPNEVSYSQVFRSSPLNEVVEINFFSDANSMPIDT